MIDIVNGDVLAVDRGIIVHGCNCQGVMGSGIAKSVREQFPAVFQAYEDVYKTAKRSSTGGLKLGQIQPIKVDDEKWIVNAMTQHLYGNQARHVNYEAVAQCFENLNEWMGTKQLIGVVPVLFPKIGAGLGGGNWKIIETIIDETLDPAIRRVLYVFHEQRLRRGILSDPPVDHAGNRYDDRALGTDLL